MAVCRDCHGLFMNWNLTYDPAWVLHRTDSREFDFMFFCPGCQCGHGFNAFKNQEPRWIFNGDMHKPTLMPSFMLSGHLGRRKSDKLQQYGVCHSFIKDGMIQFLSDSTHALAGKTVALEPW